MYRLHHMYSRFTQAYTSLSGQLMPDHLLRPTARTGVRGAAPGDELYFFRPSNADLDTAKQPGKAPSELEHSCE